MCVEFEWGDWFMHVELLDEANRTHRKVCVELLSPALNAYLRCNDNTAKVGV